MMSYKLNSSKIEKKEWFLSVFIPDIVNCLLCIPTPHAKEEKKKTQHK